MGISRASLREALSALQLAGIIETIQGDGTYVVQKRSKNSIFKALALRVLEEYESPFEALRARKILESGIVTFLASSADAAKLEEIEPILDSMEEAIEAEDFDKYFEMNRRFHLTLAKATDNSLIIKFLDYLLSVSHQPLWLEAVQKYFAEYNHIKKWIKQHRRIVAAIRNGKKELALKRIKNHFDNTVTEVKKYL